MTDTTLCCGCDVCFSRRGLLAHEYKNSAYISQCPLHKTAPALLKALKIARQILLDAGGDPMPTLDAIINEAEGK